MSNQYIYPSDQAIIIQDGTIIWNDQSQSSLCYLDANDTVINDSTISDSTINDSYATAIDSNETQYLSILEQSDEHEVTLEDLNLTVENEAVSNIALDNDNVLLKTNAESAQENIGGNDAQVFVFTLDDELYGIQLSVDEAGNCQKYQFKFRTTQDGQLEPIPETVVLLPNDEQVAANSDIQSENVQTEENPNNESNEVNQFYLVQTPLNTEKCNIETLEDDNEVNDGINDDNNPNNIYIKGEPSIAEHLEESTSTDEVDPQMFQHLSGEPDIPEHLEETPSTVDVDSQIFQQLCIKTEIAERAAQGLQPLSNVFNIKNENFKTEYVETQQEQENDIFDKTIQNDPFCDEEQFVAQQEHEIHVENEEPLYQSEEQPGDNEQFEENCEEHFVTDMGHNVSHEELVQHFISENNQIEVQYETELDSPGGTSEGDKEICDNNQEVFTGPSEDCNNQDVPTDYVEDYLEQNVESFIESSEDAQVQLEQQYTDQSEDIAVLPAPSMTTTILERFEPPLPQRSNILKHPIAPKNDDNQKKPLVSVKYYIVYPEKENVNSMADHGTACSQLSLLKLSNSNPRSVLRTSIPVQKGKVLDVPTDDIRNCDLYHKRFAKNKDAMRAKHFHHFLNRTTIPHAPIRHERQPRKQSIKPAIERSDEEIIVQEVIVSSGGFIEGLSKKVKNKKIQVTAVVELSDSEEDSTNTGKTNRRKTSHLLRDTPESEISIIEILSDAEDQDNSKKKSRLVTSSKSGLKGEVVRNSPVTLKRRRGRPPKIKKSKLELPLASVNRANNQTIENKTAVPQCDNIVSVSGATEDDKQEYRCPFCPKSFPSQNSLNTHKIHHNLENSLKSKVNMNPRPSFLPRQSLLPKVEYNHKCVSCSETFKNIILLQKHNCSKKQTSFSCSVCLKSFRDITLLNIHKKSHAKSNLVKNTSIAKVSPKKIIQKASTSLMKTSMSSPKKRPLNIFKCSECPRVCDSEEKLTIHIKTHKKYVCSSCFSTFASKLLLDTHVRTNCVKVKGNNKRLSFTIRKSFIHTPPRRQSIAKKNDKLDNTMNQSALAVKLECDKCQMKFSTFRNLYTHKVQKHGMSTPDKSVMTKPKSGVYKPKAAHGGIPANDRMKKAYAALRKKLAETEDLIIQ